MRRPESEPLTFDSAMESATAAAQDPEMPPITDRPPAFERAVPEPEPLYNIPVAWRRALRTFETPTTSSTATQPTPTMKQ